MPTRLASVLAFPTILEAPVTRRDSSRESKDEWVARNRAEYLLLLKSQLEQADAALDFGSGITPGGVLEVGRPAGPQITIDVVLGMDGQVMTSFEVVVFDCPRSGQSTNRRSLYRLAHRPSIDTVNAEIVPALLGAIP